MARNFHVVSTCSSGNGGLDGKKALRARCSITAESLPIEYSITGRSASAATSRMMWMLSASRRCRWVSRSRDTAGVRDAAGLEGKAFARSKAAHSPQSHAGRKRLIL